LNGFFCIIVIDMQLKVILWIGVFMMSLNINGQNVQIINQDSLIKLVHLQPDSGVIIINFWATWCKPCVEELPYFKKADSVLKADNYQFVFISMDKTSMIKAVGKFITSQGIIGNQYLAKISNINQMIDAVDRSWGGSIPFTIVLSKNDRKIHEGAFDSYKDLWNFIRED
jgi:thiol-disulfide isomerase/thioredoxin